MEDYEPFKPQIKWVCKLKSDQKEYELLTNHIQQLGIQVETDWFQNYKLYQYQDDTDLYNFQRDESKDTVIDRLMKSFLYVEDGQYSKNNYLQFKERKIKIAKTDQEEEEERNGITIIEKYKTIQYLEVNRCVKQDMVNKVAESCDHKPDDIEALRVFVKGKQYRLGDHIFNLGYFEQQKIKRKEHQRPIYYIVLEILYQPLSISLTQEEFKDDAKFTSFMLKTHEKIFLPVIQVIFGNVSRLITETQSTLISDLISQKYIENIEIFKKDYKQLLELQEKQEFNEVYYIFYMVFSTYYLQ